MHGSRRVVLQSGERDHASYRSSGDREARRRARRIARAGRALVPARRAPTDNVSELTARTNDEGWETVFAAWLRTSKANDKDAIFVFSVGGGDAERNVSANLVHALDEGKRRGLKIFGVVGRNGGHTKKIGDNVIVVPTVDAALVTPHTESFQAVVWHCLVSHPQLQIKETKR